MKMNICTSCDNNFIEYLYTFTLSLITNISDDNIINLYILDGNIEEKNKLIIEKIVHNTKHKIIFIKPNIEKYNNWFDKIIINKEYYSPAVFYRLEIPSLIPNVDKVLYLDCDIIVNKDISDLYNIDIDNYYICAIEEEGRAAKTRKKIFNLDHYFSSGVMLINNKMWINNGVKEDFETFFNLNYNKIMTVDQDIINCVFKDKIKSLDKKFNYFPFNETENDIPSENLYIIHYSSYLAKPLNENIKINWYLEEFWKYFCLTPWFQENPAEYINIMINQKINIALEKRNYDLSLNQLNDKNIKNSNKLELLEKEIINKSEALEKQIQNIINKLVWFIPIKSVRNKIRNDILRPDQTRPDQTRPLICKEYIYINNITIKNKLQPMLHYKDAA